MCVKSIYFYLQLVFVACCLAADCGPRLKYAWGDALQNTDCPGPDGTPYPKHLVNKALKSGTFGLHSVRQGRAGPRTLDPTLMRRALLEAHMGLAEEAHAAPRTSNRTGRSNNMPGILSSSSSSSCGGARLCRTRYNTTAPMYGVSLTSGQPVTIVQKFPDLLQQVVFEVCESSECSVVRGSCTQTYVPYLFLVLPLGPVTLTGQDYVLVESGCVCKPDPMGP